MTGMSSDKKWNIVICNSIDGLWLLTEISHIKKNKTVWVYSYVEYKPKKKKKETKEQTKQNNS